MQIIRYSRKYRGSVQNFVLSLTVIFLLQAAAACTPISGPYREYYVSPMGTDAAGRGQPDAYAFLDDSNGIDDEDGLVLAPSGWVAGNSFTATITVNGDAGGVAVYYGYWIDWDNNASFETYYSGSAVTGNPTPVNVTVNVPSGYVAGSRVYMRVRASDTLLTSADYQSTRVNGEVEDYFFQFKGGTSTLVTLRRAQDRLCPGHSDGPASPVRRQSLR